MLLQVVRGTQHRHVTHPHTGPQPLDDRYLRAHVTIDAQTNEFVWIEEIVDLAEKQASCELYGLLKRQIPLGAIFQTASAFGQ